MDKKHLFVRARFLLPLSGFIGKNTRIEDGYILTSESTILEVGKYTDEIGKAILNTYSDNLKIIGSDKTDNLTLDDLRQINGVILPGFVKCHGHDHESPVIGIAKDVPLTTWLDEAINMFTGFMNEEFESLKTEFDMSPFLLTYLKARLDDIHYGITSSLVHDCNFNKYHVPDLVKANTIAGTNMIIAVGSQDRHYDERILDIPAQSAVDRLDKYWNEFNSTTRVKIIPGPDQFFSNGPELLSALKEWSNKHSTLFHIHSSEEPATTKWFKETYGQTPIEYGASLGILDKNTLLAHQVNCTEEDLTLIAKSGASVVHNPLANTILGSGMPPILSMIEKGIPVVISTDGSGSADNQNIINAARLASQFQKAFHKDASVLPAQKVLEMITVDAAKALQLDAGPLEAGKNADFIVFDLSPTNLTPTRVDNLVENLIWAANGSEILHTIVNGKLLMENKKVLTLDEDKIKKNIQTLSEKLAEYIKTARPITGTGVH